jgi:hypothetical protein
MKKGIIVLLITVLVAGFAFAGTLKGSAGISFQTDLDAQKWGFIYSTSAKYNFSFELDTTAVEVSEHSTDLWAEIAAEASAKIALKDGPLGTGAVNGSYSAKITKAYIHVGEITFGILNAGTAADFAAHYTLDDNGDPIFDTVAGGSKLVPGFTVAYKDWNGGFGAQGTWGDNPAGDTYQVWAHVETPDFKFAEDSIAVSAGAYAFITDKDNTNATNFGGSAKGAYTSDVIDADIAADVIYSVPAETVVYEAAANATLKVVKEWPITLNVYATPGKAAGIAGYDKEMKLDAKVSTKGKVEFNEKSALDVTAYVEVTDALVKALALKAGATETLAIDKLAVALGETVTLKNLANEDLKVTTTLDLSAKVTYTADKFTAYAQVKPSFLFDDVDSNEVLTALGVECGISSTAIVENATLALTYKKADFAKVSDAVKAKGVITASATITF